MAIPTTIIPARVKEKVATEEQWLAVEDELGVILDGEAAWVRKADGTPVNFKIGTGDKKFSELPYFIAYFNNVTNCKTLFYIDQSTNITIPITFRNYSVLATLYFINNSGSEQTLKMGVTDGGSEVAEITVPNGVISINIDYLFTSAQTLYITGLDGVNYSMVILYYQLDEAPVIPSGGEGGLIKRWIAGTIYEFIPLYEGHTAAVWDLLTGLGKTGTDYEGAVLFGTNDLPSLSETYLIGYKNGDTLGGITGENEFEIEEENLPEHFHYMFKGTIGGPDLIDSPESGVSYMKNSGISRDYIMAANPGTGPDKGRTSVVGEASPTPISRKPKSKIVFYFTGILTT